MTDCTTIYSFADSVAQVFVNLDEWYVLKHQVIKSNLRLRLFHFRLTTVEYKIVVAQEMHRNQSSYITPSTNLPLSQAIFL